MKETEDGGLLAVSKVRRIEDVDVYGGKWRIVGRIFDPLDRQAAGNFVSQLVPPNDTAKTPCNTTSSH